MNEIEYKSWLEALIRQQIREAMIKQGRIMHARQTDLSPEAQALKIEMESLFRKVADDPAFKQAIAQVFENMIKTVLADAEAQRRNLHST